MSVTTVEIRPLTGEEIIARGKVLMEFRYPPSMLAQWLVAQVKAFPVRVRYRSACGRFVAERKVRSRGEAGLLHVECPRHGTERVEVIV